MKLFKEIAMKKTNSTRMKHEECFSQERVELGDNPSTCGTYANYSN